MRDYCSPDNAGHYAFFHHDILSNWSYQHANETYDDVDPAYVADGKALSGLLYKIFDQIESPELLQQPHHFPR